MKIPIPLDAIRGVSMVEFGLLIALLLIASLVGIRFLGQGGAAGSMCDSAAKISAPETVGLRYTYDPNTKSCVLCIGGYLGLPGCGST